jgi:hypothetical protein
MIIMPSEEGLATFNRDGSNGAAYVAHLPKHTGLYLVIPVRHWDKQ